MNTDIILEEEKTVYINDKLKKIILTRYNTDTFTINFTELDDEGIKCIEQFKEFLKELNIKIGK
jgi:hypothetical protein